MIASDQKNTTIYRYSVALKHVNRLRNFYRHLLLYPAASLLILLIDPYVIHLLGSNGINDAAFLNWVHWNMVLTPIIWAVVLQIHATIVFWHSLQPFLARLIPGFIRKWEERQIRKFMKEESVKYS